jgi:PGF-CTERM protein
VKRSENISGPYPIVPVGANDSQTRQIVGEAEANASNRTYQEIQEAVDLARPGEENQRSEAAPGTVEEPRQGVPGFEAALAVAGILSALLANARRRH